MSDENPRRVYPYLGLTIGVLSLGFSAIFVRLALAPGPVINVYRMGIATLLLGIPFFQRVKKSGARLSREGLLAAFLAGVFFSGDLVLWTTGVGISGATNPTLLANTAPLWVGLGAAVLLGERRGNVFWVGLIVAVSGSALILGQDALQSAELGWGTLLGLFASFFYGGYFLFTQRARKSLSSPVFFWIVVATSTIIMLLMSWILGLPLTGYTRATYLNLIALGVLVQSVGWLAINYAQGYLPAAVVSPTLLGQPVVTAVVASLLLGERLTSLQVGAGLVVLAGVYMVHRSQRPAP